MEELKQRGTYFRLRVLEDEQAAIHRQAGHLGVRRRHRDRRHEVLARLNGKMRQYRIRVIAGDRVTVGVSPYDLKRGLITYRAK